jgi:hypothetical protein
MTVVLPDVKRCATAQCQEYSYKMEGVCCLATAFETGTVKVAVKQFLGFEGQNPTNRPQLI